MANTPNPSFIKAISVFGSQAAMARAIGKPAQLINQIKQGERPMPDSWAPLIEEKTAALGSTVFCEALAPAVNWGYLRRAGQALLQRNPAPELAQPTPQTQEAAHG